MLEWKYPHPNTSALPFHIPTNLISHSIFAACSPWTPSPSKAARRWSAWTNVPLCDGRVTDDTARAGHRAHGEQDPMDGGSAIPMSHLGRPKGRRCRAEPETRGGAPAGLWAGCPALRHRLRGRRDANRKGPRPGPGRDAVLENLRFHPEEEAGDEAGLQRRR